MSYGFSFTTNHGKEFDLENISPALFLENLYISGSGPKTITRTYPDLSGNCEVFATLKSANMDDPYTYGPRISITKISGPGVTIEINPNGSGSDAFYQFTIYARSIV